MTVRRSDGRTVNIIGTVVMLAVWPSVRLTAQCPDGTPPPCSRPAARVPAPPGNSVAVLYFENLGRDTADAYIADGLTEEVTARLGQVGRLTVTSRTAVRRLHNAADLPTLDLGRRLGVSYLVSGSVRRAGERLRVTVELVRASSGTMVWNDQFDRSTADLLGIQEEIARAVATGIAGRLLPAERASIAARPTRNPQAYDRYLRGNRVMNVVSPASLNAAIGEFEAALRLDPSFTAARGRIALAYAQAINWNLSGPGTPPETLLARGLAASARALREDSGSSEAWLGRGVLLMFANPVTFEGGLEALQRSLTLDPENSRARQWYAILLRRQGRFDEATAEYRRSAAIEPTDAQNPADLGFIALSRRRYAEAIREYHNALALDSTRWQDNLFLSRALFESGDSARALEIARDGVRFSGGQRIAVAMLAAMEARTGDAAAGRQRLAPVVQLFSGTERIPVRDGYELAAALLATGDRDAALDVLERTPRGAWLWSYLVFPDFDPIRTEPRFQSVFSESAPPNAPGIPQR